MVAAAPAAIVTLGRIQTSHMPTFGEGPIHPIIVLSQQFLFAIACLPCSSDVIVCRNYM